MIDDKPLCDFNNKLYHLTITKQREKNYFKINK